MLAEDYSYIKNDYSRLHRVYETEYEITNKTDEISTDSVKLSVWNWIRTDFVIEFNTIKCYLMRWEFHNDDSGYVYLYSRLQWNVNVEF